MILSPVGRSCVSAADKELVRLKFCCSVLLPSGLFFLTRAGQQTSRLHSA